MKRYIDWFKEGKFFFIYLILLAFIIELDNLNVGFEIETNIRIYGLLLQLIGSITLVISLRERLILFKGWKLIDFFKDFFRRFPSKGKHIYLNVNDSIHIQSSTNAEIRRLFNPSEDINETLRYFNEEINSLHEKLTKFRNELKLDLKKIDSKMEEHKSQISKELFETKKLVTDSSVSNIWLDLFGIFSILTGLVLATIPDIIAKFYSL
jgi:hypothetical protein